MTPNGCYDNFFSFSSNSWIQWADVSISMDHIERGNIDFRSLQFRVLDEVDEMLKIGFVDDVKFILVPEVEDASQVQILLFSATLPSWVKHISSKFLKPDKKTVDLVGDEKMKASKNVRHIIIRRGGASISSKGVQYSKKTKSKGVQHLL
ncbi:hypothetical protein P3L10_030897 [Capsicum annuum]